MKTFLLILLACLASLAVVESQFNLDIGTGLGLLALKVSNFLKPFVCLYQGKLKPFTYHLLALFSYL